MDECIYRKYKENYVKYKIKIIKIKKKSASEKTKNRTKLDIKIILYSCKWNENCKMILKE